MKKAVLCFAVTWGCCGYASTNLTPLHENEGQMMVQRDFLLCPFEKGAFGNDVSLLLPFLWSTPSKDAYSCFSAAEQQYSDGISWEIRKVADGRMMPSIHEWTPSTDVWFLPFQLFVVKWQKDKRHLQNRLLLKPRNLGGWCVTSARRGRMRIGNGSGGR